MPRDYVINGESLVNVKGRLGAGGSLQFVELGLTEGPVRLVPRFVHKDIYIDDFGPEIPVETAQMLAEVNIYMTLVHYDRDALLACVGESMGGALLDGDLAPCGTMMGGGQPVWYPKNHYVSLNITSQVNGLPWRFPASYLTSKPLEYPLGTERSLVSLAWRAIPYKLPFVSSGLGPTFDPDVGFPQGTQFFASGLEITSSGTILWDHLRDTNPVSLFF